VRTRLAASLLAVRGAPVDGVHNVAGTAVIGAPARRAANTVAASRSLLGSA